MSNKSTESVVETAIAVSTPNAVITTPAGHSSNDHFLQYTTFVKAKY
jgi:hypothetical protein